MDVPAKQLNLAHVESFTVGQLRVEPALRLVRNGDSSEIIEPRVMQLLVALHDAGGQIVSRDDLVDRCWNGRFVGDNAIQRAVSHARKIAEGIGGGSFKIETIRGVGYRVTQNHTATQLAPSGVAPDLSPRLTRRAVVAAAGVSAVAAVGLYSFFGSSADAPSEMAQKLYAQGEAARREQDGDITAEAAVAFYSEAVRISPRFADAWAGLALAYCDLLEVTKLENQERVARLAQSAAARCLDLDPSNANAQLAKLLVIPPFRRWDQFEAQIEPLHRKDDENWLIASILGRLAADKGNFEAAIEQNQRALDLEPLLPRVFGYLAYANWAAGRLHDAEQLLDQGTQRWPRSWWLWNIRFQVLTFEGQLETAERYVSNGSKLPWNLSQAGVPKRLKLIRALESNSPSVRTEIVQAYVSEGREHLWAVRNAALPLAALGAHDELFELLRGFYLGVGRFARPLSPYSRRPTYFLFLPPMRTVHSDPRFAALLSAIGLDAAVKAGRARGSPRRPARRPAFR